MEYKPTSSIEIKITGLENTLKRIDAQKAKVLLRRSLREIGKEWKEHTAKEIRKVKTGKRYYYAPKKTFIPAGLPFKYSAKRSGLSIRAMSFKVQDHKTLRLYTNPGLNVYYAGYLEYGTRNMKPRPNYKLGIYDLMRDKKPENIINRQLNRMLKGHV